MTQIPILAGIYADATSQLRTALPRNRIPVPTASGISNGYLAPGVGIDLFANGNAYGLDRGGINWNGAMYRVLGEKLVRVDSSGGITPLGSVYTDGNPVSLDYSFDRLS